MGFSRKELMPGVWLSHICSDKFKTAIISFSFLTQLDRETASMNALIPSVLVRGSMNYPDMEKLSNRMDELYGADVAPLVRLSGEIQCTGICTYFPEAKYLPVGKDYTKEVIGLSAEILLHPFTRGGLLYKEYVDSEKQKLADHIRSVINEKNSYAIQRCIEEMCSYESYAIGKEGSAEDCESIGYVKLSKHYKELLSTSPLEIIYCGSESEEAITEYLTEALVTMPRGEINYELGTDIRMNSVEEEARYFEEQLDVTQGKLVIGFRLGEWMNDPDAAILSVFNCMYGSGVTSRLFRNVREKLQLCYYASSFSRLAKGILLVTSGIDFDKFDSAKDEILRQLDELRSGEFTDEEIAWAKASVISSLKGIPDGSGPLEGYYFSRILNGDIMTPEEYAAAVDAVTREQIIEIAESIVPDLIYFLRNDPDAEEGSDENTGSAEELSAGETAETGTEENS